jgi:hypothetical protein
MRSIFKGLTLGLLVPVLLAACSEEPVPPDGSGLLDFVPAETPYVFVSSRRLPQPIGERLADHAARQLAMQRVAFEQILQELEREQPDVDLPPEALRGFAVVDAVLAEFEGRDTAAKLRELGIEPLPRAVYFGIGILPAARIEILDPVAVEQLFERIEQRAGVVTLRGELAGQSYRRIDLGRVDAVLAITPDELIAGLLPDALFERELPLLLGQVAPNESLRPTGIIGRDIEQYGFAGYGEGFVRVDSLIGALLGRSSGLNADVMQALDAEALPASPACRQLVEGLASGMPRMVVGVSEAAGQRLAVRGIWETTDNVSRYLQPLAAPVPGVGSDYEGLLAVGMGIDLLQLRTALEALLRHVVTQGRDCEWVEPAAIEAAIPQLSLFLGPMTAGIRGFNLQLVDVEFDQQTLQPRSIAASLLAAVDDPRGVLALGAMFNPALGALEVPTDGTPVDLPADLIGEQTTPPLRVAIKDRALLLLAGDPGAVDSQALFSGPLVEPAPLFSIDYGVSQLVDALGGVLEQTASRLAAEGDSETANQLLAQRDDFRLQAELFDRFRVSLYANGQGLVMDQVMELR